MCRQVFEESGFTAGRTMVRGKLHSRDEHKRTDYLLSYHDHTGTGTGSQVETEPKHLRVGDIEQLKMPLPSLAKQQRIVAKGDQLMALCDQLKSQLSQARQLNQQLASTLVEQAVA